VLWGIFFQISKNIFLKNFVPFLKMRRTSDQNHCGLPEFARELRNEGDLWSIFYKHQQENHSLKTEEKRKKKPPHFETQPCSQKMYPNYLKVNT